MHTHEFVPSGHAQYERCATCDSLHSITPFPRENYLSNYWGNGRSTMAEQRWNLETYQNEAGDTKIQSILRHLRGKTLVEIAAAPGSLLKAAVGIGMEAVGIEPSEDYSRDIEAYSGCNVFRGFFEDMKLNPSVAENIVAMDLFEHLEDGEGFIEKCMDALAPKGRLILMAPFIYDDGEFNEKNYHPEHLWLYSQKYLKEWLNPIIFDRFEVGHEIIVIEKNELVDCIKCGQPTGLPEHTEAGNGPFCYPCYSKYRQESA